MRTKHSLRHLVAVAVVLSSGAAACSSGTDEVVGIESPSTASPSTGSEPSSTTPGTTAAPEAVDDEAGGAKALAAARLDVSDVEPLERVGVTGVDVAGQLAVAFPLADGTWGATPVLDDDEGWYFLAPPNVADPAGGGTIEILLTDGASISPPLTLNVLPLGDRPGGFEQELAAMVAAVDEDAAIFGSSWEELVGTSMDDLPRELTGLKVVQMLIDDGDGGGVAGAYAALKPDAAAVVDALIVKVGLTAPVGLDLPDDAFPPDSAAPTGFAGRAVATAPDVESDSSSVVARPAGFRSGGGATAPALGGADCIPFPKEENVDAERLSVMMTKSRIGEIATDSSQGPGRLLSASEMAFGVSALFEALATKGESKIAATIAQAVAARKMQHALNAGLMPSFFSNLDVEFDETQHEEDRVEPGHWTKVWVTAQSTGYSLDADLVGIAVDSAAAGTIGRAGLEEGTWIEIEAGAAGGEVKNTVNDLLGQTSTVSFCPNTWRVDIAGENWSWARPLDGFFTVDTQALTFRNDREIGSDRLSFAPWPFRFGGATISTEVPVSTEAIDVDIVGDVVWVTTPGETVSIATEIDHAVVQTLAWLTPKGRWADGIGADTNGPGSRPLVTPTSPNDYPFRIEVESTSRQGLRARDGAPRRYDFVDVKLAPIIVLPNPGSVEVRKSIDFTATDHEGDPIDVNWSATGGTISGSGSSVGTYTARDRPGEYEVTARLTSNPAVYVTVPVFVGEDCLSGRWQVNAAHFAELMSEGGIQVTPAGGTWFIDVAPDRTFTSTLDGFAIEVTQEGITATMQMDGAMSGSIVATATEVISITTDEMTLAVTMSFGGQTIQASPDDAPIGTAFGGGPYYCEDGVLHIERDGQEVLYDRVD